MIYQNDKQTNFVTPKSQTKQLSKEVLNNSLFNQINQNADNQIKLNDSLIHNERKEKIKKKAFSIQEDNYLISLVKQIGDNNWLEVSKMMKKMNYERSSRQCRDRYVHYLNPKLNNDLIWSSEEDDLLIHTVSKYGNKWKLMENIFPGRSEVALRNRYRKIQRKKNKEERNGKSKKNIMSNSFSFLDSIKKPSRKRKKIEKKIDDNNKLPDIVYDKNDNTQNIKKKEFCDLLEESNLFSFCNDDDLRAYLF